jgi:enoyl-CoA hydratase
MVKWSAPFKDEDVEYPVYEKIEYQKDGPIGRIVLNSPEKRNPLGYQRLLEIGMAAKQMELDDEIKVIIIKGQGPSFCAGYDITPIPEGEDEINLPASGIYTGEDRDGPWGAYNVEHLRVFELLWNLQKPVITQIHGYCLAGGTELAGFSDLRIVAEDAQIGWPVGRHWSPGNLQYLPWIVGMTKSKYYMFTNEPMDGTEAFRCDWASRVFPADELEERTEEIARQIALTDTNLIMMTKRSINRQFEIMGMRNGIMSGNDLLTLAYNRPSSREFERIANEQGLKAALTYRDESKGIKYRTSDRDINGH